MARSQADIHGPYIIISSTPSFLSTTPPKLKALLPFDKTSPKSECRTLLFLPQCKFILFDQTRNSFRKSRINKNKLEAILAAINVQNRQSSESSDKILSTSLDYMKCICG